MSTDNIQTAFNCFYCGKPGFKTDGAAHVICVNRAFSGTCFNAEDIMEMKKVVQVRQFGINPNTSCPCGSGKKYKKCCRDKENNRN